MNNSKKKLTINYPEIFLFAFIISSVVFLIFCKKDYQPYNYFVPLANSFLNGHLDVSKNPILSELVQNGGRYFVVFPPVPAVLLLPFVAVWGNDFNQTWASVLYASLAVGFFALICQQFFSSLKTTVYLTLMFAFGTVLFYLTIVGSGWFFAQITGVMFLLLALYFSLKGKVIFCGIFLACAFLCRLDLALSFPIMVYFLLRNEAKEHPWTKTCLDFAIPIIVGIGIYAVYNYLRFGSIFQTGYSLIPGVLNLPRYSKGILSLSYIPRSFGDFFGLMPIIHPKYPYIIPSEMGLAIWITTPALFLLFWLKRNDKYVFPLLLQALLLFLFVLTHGETGWKQFGMRFSLDFIIFLIIPIGYVFQRIRPIYSWSLLALCLIVNFWGAILYQLGLFRFA